MLQKLIRPLDATLRYSLDLRLQPGMRMTWYVWLIIAAFVAANRGHRPHVSRAHGARAGRADLRLLRVSRPRGRLVRNPHIEILK